MTAPVSDKTTAANYKQLFGLYQGLTALSSLADLAAGKNVTAYDQARYQNAFQSGMTEMQKYLDGTPFQGFDVVQGKVSSSLKTTIGAKAETDVYTTQTVYTGSINGEVPAFQGDVRFSAKVVKGGTTTNLDFDLSEMGSTPRTMGNVVNYMNDKLHDQGVSTKFAVSRTPGDGPDRAGGQVHHQAVDGAGHLRPADQGQLRRAADPDAGVPRTRRSSWPRSRAAARGSARTSSSSC